MTYLIFLNGTELGELCFNVFNDIFFNVNYSFLELWISWYIVSEFQLGPVAEKVMSKQK